MTNPNLSSRQFVFIKAEPRAMGGSKFHTVRAVDDAGEHLGAIRWSHKTGEIENISTWPQREGTGTALWHEARRIASETRGVRPPRHSSERTVAGEAWARSLGGRLPRLT